MNMLAIVGAAVTGLVASSAAAQAVRSEVIASNGVAVTVHADEFANRYEYTAPAVRFEEGFALVARVKSGGTAGPLTLQGNFMYNGEWRFYDSAIFRGGTRADFTGNDRDVVSCRGSRYSRGCTLSEGFAINLTPAQVTQFTQDGVLAIQIRSSRTASSAMVQIPVSYIDAVNEVSGR